MKIKENEIRDVAVILDKLYAKDMVQGRASLFLPIDEGEKLEETEEGIIIPGSEIVKAGSHNLVKAGLMISNEESITKLAYATTEYAVKFDFAKYVMYSKNVDKFPLTKKEIELISQYEWLLIRNESILINFKTYI